MIKSKKTGQLEEKAYRSYHDDGLLEILLGLSFIAVGIGSVFHQALIMIVIPSVALPVWMAAKKVVTLPRYGHVKFGPQRQMRIKKEIVFFVVFFTFTAVLGLVAFLKFGDYPEWVDSLFNMSMTSPIALISAVGIAFLGYWRQLVRFYIYAVVLLVAIFVGPQIGLRHGYDLIAMGVLILVPGLVYLARFLQKYPKSVEEAPSGGC